MLWVIDAGMLCYLGKGTISIVVIEGVRRPFQSSRPALDRHVFILAGLLGAKKGQILQIQIDIVWNKQVDFAVAVIVAKS